MFAEMLPVVTRGCVTCLGIQAQQTCPHLPLPLTLLWSLPPGLSPLPVASPPQAALCILHHTNPRLAASLTPRSVSRPNPVVKEISLCSCPQLQSSWSQTVATHEGSSPLRGETSATSRWRWETHCFLVVCIYRNHWLKNSSGKPCYPPQNLQKHPFYSLINQTYFGLDFFF